MRPQSFTIAHLIQLGNADTILICRNMLCYDVHSNFAEEEVCADTGCSRDAGCLKNIQNDFHGKVSRCKSVCVQIVCDIHKHFINGVDYNIFRGNILQVDFVNSRTVLHVISHSRRCDNEVNRKLWIGL